MRAFRLTSALLTTGLAACSGGTTSPSTTQPASASVSVLDNQFSPSSVTIRSGGTVTWTWGSQGQHNVIGDDAKTPPRSGNTTAAPNTYSFTFSTPGTYRYYCEAHGQKNGVGMSGTVTVQ
jgi:plastocyanin